ncbi:MAG TPA: sigma-70 family RNA polymerase sigma factor [Propionibacteriaceae bacterium]
MPKHPCLTLGKRFTVEVDDDPGVIELVQAAASGDGGAWESLVKRYMPLVTSVAMRYRVVDDDLADVSQTVWLQLVQHLGQIRTPAALPGWLVTTTRNECFRITRVRRKTVSVDPQVEPPARSGGNHADIVDFDRELVQGERHAALLAAFAELSDQHRELLLLMRADPPLSYEDISQRLGIPIGGIGPTRARALDRLRRSPAMAALMTDDLADDLTKRTGR